jgi:hypothetical protein
MIEKVDVSQEKDDELNMFEYLREYYELKTEKPFDYRLLQRNELSLQTSYNIPPLELDNPMLTKTLGMCILTETFIKKSYIFNPSVFKSPKSFVQIERWTYPNYVSHNTFLCNFSVYIGDIQILTIFDVYPEHFFYQAENAYKISHYCYDAACFAFLEARLIDVFKQEDLTTICFLSTISENLFAWSRYTLLRYGSIPAQKLFSSWLRKYKYKVRRLEKQNV